MPACACLQPGVVFLAAGPPCLAECSPLPAHRLQCCLHSLYSILPGEFTMIELAEMVKKVVNPKAEVRHGWLPCTRGACMQLLALLLFDMLLPSLVENCRVCEPPQCTIPHTNTTLIGPNHPNHLPFSHHLQLVFVENTADDPSRRKPDITKAKTLLGWQPKVGWVFPLCTLKIVASCYFARWMACVAEWRACEQGVAAPAAVLGWQPWLACLFRDALCVVPQPPGCLIRLTLTPLSSHFADQAGGGAEHDGGGLPAVRSLLPA